MNRLVAALALAAAALPAQNSERSIDYGFELRVRNENWNNQFDFSSARDDQRSQIRYRARTWMRAPLHHNIDISLGLDSETNEIVLPHTPTHFDEVVFETAQVDIKQLFVKGLSLRFGRQNIMKGEGFLFLEGNPYDGSRSIYMNAATLTYATRKAKIEFIGISNPRTDRYLPRFNDRHRQLIEWNEQALGTYITANARKNTAVEGYYFYKKEFGDTRAKTNPQYQPDRYLYTAGGRAVHKLPRHFSLTGEFAGQWGHQRPSTAIRGWGGYAYLKRTFGAKDRHYASFGYWGMSGDDPSTPGRNENWDPLFSRWPKWSEMYIYTQFTEVGVAYWTNTSMWQGELGYSPWKPLNMRFTYYHMNAFHPYLKGNRLTYSTGTTRGDQYQVRADLVANKYLKGHILYENHVPGSFYSGKQPGWFLRFEVISTFTGKWSY